MRALLDALRRLGSLVRRQKIEDRLDDEIRFHVEQQIEKNQRAGMRPDEARRQAMIRFGGVEVSCALSSGSLIGFYWRLIGLVALVVFGWMAIIGVSIRRWPLMIRRRGAAVLRLGSTRCATARFCA